MVKKLLSVHEYAELWGYAHRTVLAWCTSGKLSGAQKVGNRMWVIPEDAVRRTRFGFTDDDLRLINELSPIDPITGKPKGDYPAPPAKRVGPRAYPLPSLKRVRKERGYTQAELATISGVSRGTINKLERGRGGTIAPNVRALSDALEVGVGELLREEEEDG